MLRVFTIRHLEKLRLTNSKRRSFGFSHTMFCSSTLLLSLSLGLGRGWKKDKLFNNVKSIVDKH